MTHSHFIIFQKLLSQDVGGLDIQQNALASQEQPCQWSCLLSFWCFNMFLVGKCMSFCHVHLIVHVLGFCHGHSVCINYHTCQQSKEKTKQNTVGLCFISLKQRGTTSLYPWTCLRSRKKKQKAPKKGPK